MTFQLKWFHMTFELHITFELEWVQRSCVMTPPPAALSLSDAVLGVWSHDRGREEGNSQESSRPAQLQTQVPEI